MQQPTEKPLKVYYTSYTACMHTRQLYIALIHTFAEMV